MRTHKPLIPHWLVCEQRLPGSARPVRLVLMAAALTLVITSSSASFPASPSQEQRGGEIQPHEQSAASQPETEVPPAVRSMESFLKRHKVPASHRVRLAKALVSSAEKHRLSPRLLASIMIVESRGNPFAVSGQGSVGIMQIHLQTWGPTADRENINLFNIEDNIDFGARILKTYVDRYGVLGGVKRYNGFIPGHPDWEASAQRYVAKLESIYEPLRGAESDKV